MVSINCYLLASVLNVDGEAWEKKSALLTVLSNLKEGKAPDLITSPLEILLKAHKATGASAPMPRHGLR